MEGLDLLDVGIGSFDKSLTLIYCNKAFKNLRNYPDDVCVPGASMKDLLRHSALQGDFGEGDPEAIVSDLVEKILSVDTREREREMADGRVLGISYRRTSDDGFIVSYTDRTAERQAQRALMRSEERYALVSDGAEEALYDWDIVNGTFFASQRLRDLIGPVPERTGEDGWAWENLVHPEDLDRYNHELQQHLTDKTVAWRCEYRLKTIDGDWIWVRDHGKSLRDEAGRGVRMVAAVRDITGRIEREAALAASEERYALVTRATSDGIYDWDVTNDKLFVSETLTRLFGFGTQKTTSLSWAEQIHEDDLPGYLDQVRGHFKGETEAIDCEYRVRIMDGGCRWVHDHGVGKRNEAGRVIRLVGAVSDITDIRAQQAEIERAQRRFEDAIEAITTGFALWDAEHRLVTSNTRYRTYFAEVADMVKPGALLTDIMREGIRRGMFPLAADDPDGYIATLLAKREAGAGLPREQFVNNMWLRITDHKTDDGGIVSIYSDITELKAKQAEIERQAELLELTLENMEQGISLVDKNLNTMAFNGKFLELLDLPEDLFKRGFSMEQAFRFNAERGEYGPGDVEEQVCTRLELAAKFEPHRFERVKPDGTVIEIVGRPIEGGGMVATYTDVTEDRRREADIVEAKEAAEAALAELREAQDRLVHSEKMASLGQLTAGIAHEIKNPLNFVNNFARLSIEMLDELAEALSAEIAQLDAEDREDIEELLETVGLNLRKINEHGARADSIVRNMLLHSRQGEQERSLAALNALVEESMNLAYHGARAETPGFNIVFEKDLAADAGEIVCYPQELSRVFLNLVSNGMYAARMRQETEDTGFEPTLSVISRSLGDRVEVKVRDNGTGIPKEVIDKIFTPFFTTKPTGQGTGLGLSLSYEIVTKLHGGRLEVQSTPGQETVFTVTLPRGESG